MKENLESELNKAKDHIQFLKGKKDYVTKVSLHQPKSDENFT